MLDFLGWWIFACIVVVILYVVFLGRPAGRYDDEMQIGEGQHRD